MLLCAGAQAGEPQWTYARSENFELFTTESPKKARQAILYFEEIRAFFLQTLKVQPPPRALPTRLIAFNNDKEFAPYRPNEFAAAFYLPSFDRDYIAMGRLDGDVYPIVVHEYVHLLIKRSGASYPLWLNEGQAELYSNMQPIGKKMQVGTLHLGRLQLLQQSKMLPLEVLFTVDHDSKEYNSKNHAGVFYSQAWALAHMLQLQEDYRPRASVFLDKVIAGEPPIEALQVAFNKTSADVYRDLERYVRQGTFYAALFDYRKSKELPDPEVTPADKFTAGIVTASLLASTRDKVDEAGRRFAALEAENPQSLELQEALSYFYWRKQDGDAAWSHFLKAMELNTQNVELLVDFGKFGLAANKKDADKALRKALEFRPGDIALLMDLGSAYLRSQRPGQALASYAQIKKITPDKAYRLFYEMSMAQASIKKFEEAQKSVNRAIPYAKDDREKERAAAMLRYLEGEMAREKQIAAMRAEEAQYREEVARRQAEMEASHAADSQPQSEKDPVPPRTLRRRYGTPVEPPSEAVKTVDGQVYRYPLAADAPAHVLGKLQNVECAGSKARLTILSQGTKHVLSVDDPSSVVIVGAGKGVVEFTCGPQKGLPVAVGYRPAAGKAAVLGSVTSLEFQ